MIYDFFLTGKLRQGYYSMNMSATESEMIHVKECITVFLGSKFFVIKFKDLYDMMIYSFM